LGFAALVMASRRGALRRNRVAGQGRGDVAAPAQAATGAAMIEAPVRLNLAEGQGGGDHCV
jgi:hypothetical protein